MSADIFISYARPQEPMVVALASALSARGWSVWWDRSIPGGQRFDAVIAQKLAEVRCVIVLWSAQSCVSQWVIEEAGEARDRDILVPVLVERVRPPFGFRNIHALSLSDWDGDPGDDRFGRLANHLEAMLNRNTAPARTHLQSLTLGSQTGSKMLPLLVHYLDPSGLIWVVLGLAILALLARQVTDSTAPIWIAILLCVCDATGRWLEAEADPEWKAAVRRYLRSGAWIDKLTDIISVSSRLFGRVYGERYVSWLVIKRTIQLSIIPLLGGFCVFAALGKPVWMLLTWDTAWFGLLPRLLLICVSDFLNIAKTRFLIGRLRRRQHSLIWLGFSLMIDFVGATSLAIAMNVASMSIFATLYTSKLRQEFTLVWQLDIFDFSDPLTWGLLLKYLHEILILDDIDGLFVYVSYLPFIALLIYTGGLFIGKLFGKMAEVMKIPITHLQYRKPFLFLFRTAGLFSSLALATSRL